MKTTKSDILIIGAGPSGTVAAAHLLREGFSIQIIEKTRFPRFVIGESLIPRCMEHFDEVGLLEVIKEQGFQKKQGAKFIRGQEECLFDFGQQFSEGWQWTWQVPRAEFDHTLAQEIQKRGAKIDFETTITHIDFDSPESSILIENKKGKKHLIKAKFIIDASGYGRVIPKMLGLTKNEGTQIRQTIFCHFFDKKRPKDNSGNQITFVLPHRDLWVWIIPFSNGVTSVGFVGNPKYFQQIEHSENLEQTFRKMISEVPQIRKRFENAELKFEPRSMKAWAVSSEQLFGDEFVITGNSSEFIDPIFSSGVTFATESGLLAAKLASRKLKGEMIDWQKDYVEHLKFGTDVFRTYVNAWYDGTLQDIFFFSAQNEPKFPASSLTEIRRQICSVLAGYVWDFNNPFVKRHKKAIRSLSNVIGVYS